MTNLTAVVHRPRGNEENIKLEIHGKERIYYELNDDGLKYQNIGNDFLEKIMSFKGMIGPMVAMYASSSPRSLAARASAHREGNYTVFWHARHTIFEILPPLWFGRHPRSITFLSKQRP